MNYKIIIRQDPIIAGVCGGLAKYLDISAGIIRIIVFVSAIMTFGVTALLYLAAVISFPTQAIIDVRGDHPKFLGVCHKLAPRIGIHESWLRFLVLIIFLFTGFFPVFVGYLILFFIQASTQEVDGSKSGPDEDNVRNVN